MVVLWISFNSPCTFANCLVMEQAYTFDNVLFADSYAKEHDEHSISDL